MSFTDPSQCARILFNPVFRSFDISRRVIEKLVSSFPILTSSSRQDTLTDREREIMGLLAKGSSNQQISEHLAIAEGTVKNHIVSIYQKLGVRSRAEAVARAWEVDLLQHHFPEETGPR